MQHLRHFRSELTAVLRGLMLPGISRFRPENPPRRLGIASFASVSLLLATACCPGIVMGQDPAESAEGPTTEVPNVPPGEFHYTVTPVPLNPVGPAPEALIEHEMPCIEHPHAESTTDISPSFDLHDPGPSLPMATPQLMTPMSSAPVILLPKTFVHTRRTIRTSERMAEIWVKLPKDSQSSVSVNFVEYPPEGEFRIFRTRINTQEPRRFYLSAKRWDAPNSRWIELEAAPTLSTDETPDLGYVDLGPGQRHVVTFTDHQSYEPPVHIPSIHARLNTIEQAISDNHAAVTNQIENVTTSIEGQVAVLQQAVAPHDKSSMVTKAFNFSRTEKTIEGEATCGAEGNLIESVNWGSRPQFLNIIAESVPRALPRIPFTAQVKFFIQTDREEPLAMLDSISVKFNSTANGFEGAVDFNDQMGTLLAKALVGKSLPLENLQLAAMMEFHLDHGELGFTRVSGELGNKVMLKVQKAAPAQ